MSALTLSRLESIALREGWQVSDLARALACFGASASFLRLRDPEASQRFKTIATTRAALGHLDGALGKHSTRPCAPPGMRSELLAVRLPQGLCRLITAYARTNGRSRNDVLATFLQHGLVLYLKGENTLLEAIRSVNREIAEHVDERSGAAHPATDRLQHNSKP